MKEIIKYHWDLEQGTEEWFKLRRGKFTASNAKTISVNGVGLQTYCRDIIEAIICPREPYTNPDLERGNELEPIARTVYEFERGVRILECGFVSSGDWLGCSPDGLVGDDGGVEIKCRNNAKHLARLLGGNMDPAEYMQSMMCMMVTGRKWWDVINYNPNFVHSLYVERLTPDEKVYKKLEEGLEAGIKTVKSFLKNEKIKVEINAVGNGYL